MADILQLRRGTPAWRVLLALACVLLVVVAGAVQVAHMHAGADVHSNCGLCAAAHLSIQGTHSPAPAPVSPVARTLEVAPAVFVPPAFSTFALFTRPPPSPAAV